MMALWRFPQIQKSQLNGGGRNLDQPECTFVTYIQKDLRKVSVDQRFAISQEITEKGLWDETLIKNTVFKQHLQVGAGGLGGLLQVSCSEATVKLLQVPPSL